MRVPSNDEAVPPRSARLFGLFRRYARRYVARHFHAVRISRAGPMPDLPARPVVVVLNHPSWWDPLIALTLTEGMPGGRVHYAPIEAVGLAQYPFLARIGFFGFDARTAAGAVSFLRKSLAILARRESVLWITAQGEFVDARHRPVRLKPGVGHLARRLGEATILPLAIEYPFWDDRCPEVLVRFGAPMEVREGRARSPREWTALIATALEAELDALASEALARDPDAFDTLIGGTAGIGGVYDSWRKLRAWMGGKRFRPEHVSHAPAGERSRHAGNPAGPPTVPNPSE